MLKSAILILIFDNNTLKNYKKSDICKGFTSFWLRCYDGVYQKIRLKVYIDLHWNFASLFIDVPDIHRFPTVHMVKTHYLLENLWKLQPSWGILEKFQYRSELFYIKYNCVVIFLSQMHWLLMYASRYNFFCKTSVCETLTNGNSVWCSRRWN